MRDSRGNRPDFDSIDEQNIQAFVALVVNKHKTGTIENGIAIGAIATAMSELGQGRLDCARMWFEEGRNVQTKHVFVGLYGLARQPSKLWECGVVGCFEDLDSAVMHLEAHRESFNGLQLELIEHFKKDLSTFSRKLFAAGGEEGAQLNLPMSKGPDECALPWQTAWGCK